MTFYEALVAGAGSKPATLTVYSSKPFYYFDFGFSKPKRKEVARVESKVTTSFYSDYTYEQNGKTTITRF